MQSLYKALNKTHLWPQELTFLDNLEQIVGRKNLYFIV